MSYKVKIDRDSIKKNPRAGMTSIIVNRTRTATFNCKGELPSFLVDGENIMITEYNYEGSVLKSRKGEIIDEETIDKCSGLKNINLTIDYDVHRVHHNPIKKWNYSYENTIVTCDNCKKHINTKDLKSDAIWNGENEYYSDAICPKCNEFDCCELEYEKFDESLIKE